MEGQAKVKVVRDGVLELAWRLIVEFEFLGTVAVEKWTAEVGMGIVVD